jgi:hypothetical protein
VVLALTGAEWTALASVLSGVIVGVGGLAFSYFNGNQERVHSERQAEAQREYDTQTRRSERFYQDRRETYLDLLRTLLILRDRVDLTEPIVTWGEMPEPPEPPSEDERRDLSARFIALGSEAVNEAARSTYEKVRAFYAAVNGYRIARDSPGLDLEAASSRMMEARQRRTRHSTNSTRSCVRNSRRSSHAPEKRQNVDGNVSDRKSQRMTESAPQSRTARGIACAPASIVVLRRERLSGLSRRRSRVRVPSLPLRFPAANAAFRLSTGRGHIQRVPHKNPKTSEAR